MKHVYKNILKKLTKVFAYFFYINVISIIITGGYNAA